MRLENEKILPMLNHAEQIIIDSLKKYCKNANCISTCMFSDTGNTMEVSPLGSRWRKSKMAAMK